MSFFERLKAEAPAEWRAYTEHPFTNGMAGGSLPEAAFRHYLVQQRPGHLWGVEQGLHHLGTVVRCQP